MGPPIPVGGLSFENCSKSVSIIMFNEFWLEIECLRLLGLCEEEIAGYIEFFNISGDDTSESC